MSVLQFPAAIEAADASVLLSDAASCAGVDVLPHLPKRDKLLRFAAGALLLLVGFTVGLTASASGVLLPCNKVHTSVKSSNSKLVEVCLGTVCCTTSSPSDDTAQKLKQQGQM